MLEHVKQKQCVNSFLPNINENEPQNMLHYLILRTINEPTSIQLNTANVLLRYTGKESAFLVGHISNDDIKNSKLIYLDRFSQTLHECKDDPNLINYPSSPLIDDDGHVLCFGNDYIIDFSEQSSENMKQLADVIKIDATGTYQTFLNVKAYYEKISRYQAKYQFL